MIATDTPSDVYAPTLARLNARFGDGVFSTSQFRDNLRLYVSKPRLLELLDSLKSECGFTFLSELGAVDYLGYPGWTRDRFGVHYVLRDLDHNTFLVVKVGVTEAEATLPTATSLWMGANWMEREVFDMYGIRFEGHPDLRRILMPDEFEAFPLRKDYPLRGRGERHNFPKLSRNQS